MLNGKPYLDTTNNPIHAHGGHMLRHNGFWYWYGEDRRDDRYVSCYRSTDLKTWEFRNVVLHVDTTLNAQNGWKCDLGEHLRKVNIERPKVLYNEKTGKFVMWAHFENGHDYREAAACVAICDTPDGDFTYLGSFNPCGHMSRDCTLFRDDDGTVYFLSAANDNRDLHVYRLTDDLLNIATQVNALYIGQLREAPAVFKKDGKYYMITSYCTGWAPNQGKWSCADEICGKWSDLRDFGDETTFRSQSAFVLPLDGKFYYVGDRWEGGGEAYFHSTYVVLEIQFNENGEPYIEFAEESPIM